MKSRRRSSFAAKVLGAFRGVDEPDSEGRTAVLLLDFQNEFVKKGGKLHGDVADTMEMTGVLENVPKLVDFARKTNAMIIYSPVVMKESGKFTSASLTGPVKNNEYSFS